MNKAIERKIILKELIIKLSDILNLMKDFSAGYSSLSSDEMMIDYKGKRYIINFDEICNSDEEEMFTSMKRYWKW